MMDSLSDPEVFLAQSCLLQANVIPQECVEEYGKFSSVWPSTSIQRIPSFNDYLSVRKYLEGNEDHLDSNTDSSTTQLGISEKQRILHPGEVIVLDWFQSAYIGHASNIDILIEVVNALHIPLQALANENRVSLISLSTILENCCFHYGKFDTISQSSIINAILSIFPMLALGIEASVRTPEDVNDFSKLIERFWIGIKLLDTFSATCFKLAGIRFDFVAEIYLVPHFAEIWNYMVTNCRIDRALEAKLPFKQVESQLLNALLGYWELNRILENQYKFAQIGSQILQSFNAQDCVSIPLQWQRYEVKLKSFDDSCEAVSTARTSIESRFNLEGLLKTLDNFYQILNSHAHATSVQHVSVTSDQSKFDNTAQISQSSIPKTEKKKKSKQTQTVKQEYTAMEMQKDIKSLRRILRYIDLALTSKEGVAINSLLFERVLQVIGESIKFTKSSPNISERTRKILEQAGIPLQKLETLRNTLSHSSGLLSTRRLYSKQDITTLTTKEFLKMEKAFYKALYRIEFLLLKKIIFSSIVQGKDNGTFLKDIEECDNILNLEESLELREGEDETLRATKLRIKYFVQQTRIHSELAQSFSVSAEEYDEVVHTNSDGSNIPRYDYNIEGKGVSKSTITQISALEGIHKLHNEFTLVKSGNIGKSAQECIPKEKADELIDSFKDLAIKNAHFSNEAYKELATELQIGQFPELEIKEIDEILKWSNETYGMDEDAKKLVRSTLQVLNKLKYLRNCKDKHEKGNEGSTLAVFPDESRSYDEFLILLLNATEGNNSDSNISMACGNLGINDAVLLTNILENMSQLENVDSQIDGILDQVVEGLGNVDERNELKKEIAYSREFMRCRAHLLSFIEAKICTLADKDSERTSIMTESEFQSSSAIVLQNLKDVTLLCKYDGSFGIKQWRTDLVTIRTKIPCPYETLRTSLKTEKSLQGSCKAIQKYLETLNISDEQRLKAGSIYKFQEENRLELFILSRMQKLENLLVDSGILVKSGTSEPGSTTQTLPTNDKTAYESLKSNLWKQAAIEILVLDLTENFANIFSMIDNFKDDSATKINIKLLSIMGANPVRNYLAHGDDMLDILNPQIFEQVLITYALKLVKEGKSLLALTKLIQNDLIAALFNQLASQDRLHEIHSDTISILLPGRVSQMEEKELKILQQNRKWQQILKEIFNTCEPEKTSDLFPKHREYGNDCEYLKCELLKCESLHALFSGNHEKLKFILKLAGNQIKRLNFRNDWTMLQHVVVMKKVFNAKVMEVLLSLTEVTNYENGNTPLHTSVLFNNVEAVKLLLNSSEINSKLNIVQSVNSFGITAAHIAAQKGSNEILDLILKKRANPTAMTLEHWTPLHFAVGCRQFESVQLLVKYGSDIMATLQGRVSPFCLSLRKEAWLQNIFEYLFTKYCDSAPIERDRKDIYKEAEREAAMNGNTEAMAFLLDHQKLVNIELLNHSRLVGVIHYAAQHGSEDIVKLLLSHHVDINSKDKKSGFTPLSLAISNAHYNIAKYLITEGAELDPIYIIFPIIHGDFHMVKFVIDFAQISPDICTPIQIQQFLESGAKSGHLETFIYVLEIFGKNIKDEMIVRLFHIAIRLGNLTIVKHLVETMKVKYTEVDSDTKQTPLHISAEAGRLTLTKYLILNCKQIGSMIKVDAEGFIPLTLAARKFRWNVVHYLVMDADLRKVEIQEEHRNLLLTYAAQVDRWSLVMELVGRDWDFSGHLPWENDPTSAYFTDMAPTSIVGIAACKCNLQVVQDLVEKGYDVKDLLKPKENKSEEGTGTDDKVQFLKELCELSNRNIFHYLQSKGLGDLLSNGIGTDLETGLHFAAFHGNIDVCEFFLIDVGLSVNIQTEDGRTALHYAVEGKCTKSTEYLIQKNADLNIVTNKGDTPLDIALGMGVFRLIKILLVMGNVDIGNYLDRNGNSLLHSYCQGSMEEGSAQMINYFVREGVNIFGVNQQNETCLHILATNSNEESIPQIVSIFELVILKAKLLNPQKLDNEMLNIKNKLDETVLHLLVKNRSALLLDILLENFGLDPFIQDVDGRTARKLALSTGFDNGAKKLALFEELLSTDHMKLSWPLKLAIVRHDWSVAEETLNHTPSIGNIGNNESRFILSEVCKCGKLDILKKLIENGVHPNQCVSNKDEPRFPDFEPVLVTAVKGGQFPVVEYLLKDKRIRPNYNRLSKRNGNTPLHIAAEYGYGDILRLLLQYGAPSHLEIYDLNNLTPFGSAVEKQMWDIVNVFIEWSPESVNKLLQDESREYLKYKEKYVNIN